MLLSVIVPFLDEEYFIEGCIHSLLNQTLDSQQYELIFIDNGSTDRSAGIVQRYNTITLLREGRQDPYLARNLGIKAAQGTFLAFTDADCIVDRHWLTRLLRKFKAENADIVLGRLKYPSPTPVCLHCYEQYYHAKLSYILSYKLWSCYFGHGGNMAVRATVFRDVGLFSGMPIVGDTAIIHQLLQYDPHARVVYEPEAIAVHAEVTHFRHCLAKLFQCGEYSETYSSCSSYRTLSMEEKYRVFKLSLHPPSGKELPLPFMVALWSLIAGFFSFELGRWRRRMQTLVFHR